MPVAITDATPGLRFRRPVTVERTPSQPERPYVAEKGFGVQPARIVTAVPGDAASTVVLDLSDVIYDEGESGLLGLAFHPDYATNGRLFVSYTAAVDDPEDGVREFVSRLSEFARDAGDPLRADRSSERILLEVEQPDELHNGGTVDFGPDGMLYISLGDGGGAGDTYQNGQDPTTLLGTILRIDVDMVPEGQRYGIPADNPFADSTGPERPEIFAYGFRNPFKFDAGAFGVWVGDVGQGLWEEIDRVVPGGNYGWNRVEGPACYCPPGETCEPCDLDAYESPVFAYPHGADTGESITGGFVEEDPTQRLYRMYLYGDFSSGRLWGLPIDDPVPVLLAERYPTAFGPGPINISSVDPGLDGAVLVTDYVGGKIYELTFAPTASEPVPEGRGPSLVRTGPNPFSTQTTLVLDSASPVRVAVVDVLGREIAVLWDGPAPDRPLAVSGRDLAPGAYVVTASSRDGTSAVPLVRVR